MSAGRVEFFLSCSDLTAHNAFIGVFLKDAETQKWIELGRTEVSYNSNPKYAKQFIVDFIFEEEQQLRFDVYRSVNGNTAFISKNVIGSAAFKLSEVVHAKHQMLTRTLTKGRKVVKNRASKRYSRLNLRLEPLNMDFNDNTAYNFHARGLPKQGAFHKANPILEMHRLGSDGKFFKVFETIVIKKNLAPKWPEFTLTTAKLCNGDNNRTLQLKIYHVDKVQRKYIGKCQTSYNKLLNDPNKTYALKDTKGKQIGSLKLASIKVLSRQQNKVQKAPDMHENENVNVNVPIANSAQIEQKMQHDMIRKLQVQKSIRSRTKFLEFLESSELSLMIAIDFTGSNGKVNDPQSLHYIYQRYTPSPYQDALRRICSIVAPYDSDQKFPIWGFGAKFPQVENVLHDFALDPNGEEVDGVNGIEEAYVNAIQSNAFQLSGPCCYSAILTKAINESIASHNTVMQSPTEKIQYYILLVLTNGQCCDEDKQTTKNRLIYASNNNLPLSIIFVGIGDNDFKFLNELDGDFDPIKDDKGNVAQRDIVQFVAMKEFKNKAKNELSKYTLREIPIQFVSYVDNNGLKPRKKQKFSLKRSASKFFIEDEDDSGHSHFKGDTMYQISQDDLDIESDEEEELKEEPQQSGSPSADPMASVPVPTGWEKSYTASGRPFYINHTTKSTQWVHPLKNQMNRQRKQSDLQKKQASAYNMQLMNNQFDNKKPQSAIVSAPIQRSNTFQPQQVYAQAQAQPQAQLQKTQSMYPQMATQRSAPQQQQLKAQTMYQPAMQQQSSAPLQPQQPRVVYVQQQQPQQVQYTQPQAQPQQRVAYDQYGRQIILPGAQQQQRVVYAQPQQQVQYGQPQQVQYGQPQQQQRVVYAQPQQGQYGQGQQQRVVYAQPQQGQYGQPQQRKQW